MTIAETSTVFEDLVELLAETANVDRLNAFRLSQEKQERLDELLDKNREGTLTDRNQAELDAFEQFEHVVRLLKARLLRKPTA